MLRTHEIRYNYNQFFLFASKEIKPAVRSNSQIKLCNFPSGSYVIDPDGEGRVKLFKVYCNMTDKGGVGVTVVSHESESRRLL